MPDHFPFNAACSMQMCNNEIEANGPSYNFRSWGSLAAIRTISFIPDADNVFDMTLIKNDCHTSSNSSARDGQENLRQPSTLIYLKVSNRAPFHQI